MLIWQILAVVLILAFIVIAVLAFIEPGPLHRRSRNPRVRAQDAPPDEQQSEP